MDSKARRDDIVKVLNTSDIPLKGSQLAISYGVTRQVIVKDIAILRAAGVNIIATPYGYIASIEEGRKKIIIAVSHDAKEMYDELETIVKYGGIIEDVIVEHLLYGEIKAMLMIKTLNDVNKFIEKYNNNEVKPLSLLTNGIHIHTISADSEENLSNIIKELTSKGYIIN